MIVITAVLVFTTSALLWWRFRTADFRKKFAKIPGPKRTPFFGNALQMRSASLHEFQNKLTKLSDDYALSSPIFTLQFGHLSIVYIMHVDMAEKILGTMKNTGKSQTYDFVKPWLQEGLLTSKGAKWHTRRKLLTPTFHFRILKDFLDVFNDQTRVLVERLASQCGNEAFDIFPYMTLCALDIICETAMGKTINAQKAGESSEYVNAIQGVADIITERIRKPWLGNDFIFNRTALGKKHRQCLNTLHTFTREVIEERQKAMEERPGTFVTADIEESSGSGTKNRMAFLNLLLHMAEEVNFSKNDIQEEVDTFMFEGHDTTSSGMSWTLYCFGRHPEVQNKVQKELDEIFGDSDRDVTMEDLSQMKYLDCVIRESHRLFPPVPIIGRYVDEDIDVGNGTIIPKGCSLAVLIWKINQDPKHWQDPEKFDPERFTPDNCAGRNPYAHIPFSAGPRNCIGQRFAMNEEKCVMAHILRKYNVEAVQTVEEIQPLRLLVLRASNGIKIKLTKRFSQI